MRDTNRLDSFYEEIQRIHKEYFPDWRFGQFIMNIISYCGHDIFYYEEDEFLEIAKNFAETISPIKRERR